MSKKLVALLLAVMMILSLAAACGKNNDVTPNEPDNTTPDVTPAPTDPADSGKKIYYTYMGGDADTLNGQNTVLEENDTPISYCSATLFRAVPDDSGKGYHYIPDLAIEMPEKVDEYTWRVKLRPEACWHNGDPINADTMMFTYKTLLDPIAVNAMANFLADNNITVVNAYEYMMQGTSNTVAWEDVGIKKIDDYTLEFKTVYEVDEAAFCTHFTNRALYPIYEPLYKECMNEDGVSSSYGATLDMWMGCGPYVFTTWDYDSLHVYTKNENYWLADLFHFDEVQVRIVPSMNARVELFESGMLDDLSPDASTLDKYIDDPRLVSYASTMVYHYDINCKNETNPLCGSLNYRKALYHAMDREVIADQIWGHMLPTGTYVNGMAGILSESGEIYRESKYGKAVTDMIDSEWGPYGYNPELALEYLKKAYEECGLSDDTVVTIKVLYGDAGEETKKTCEFFMEEFPKIFEGRIEVVPNVITSGMALEYMESNLNDWDLVLMDWGRSLSRTLPYQCYYYFLESYSAHPNNYFDKEFDDQFAACEAVKEGDYETILQETEKLERIHLDKVINIPVVQCVNYIMFSERLDLPVDNYIPGFGWGTMYADIAE